MIKSFILSVINSILSLRLPKWDAEQSGFVGELREAVRTLSIQNDDDMADSACEWIENMAKLKKDILNKDPRKFLQWDVVKHTMFIAHAHFIRTEFRKLSTHALWRSRWRNAVQESAIGCPFPYLFYPKSSANLIHHAYHLLVFEETSRKNIRDFQYVVEFGGGYGSMCRLFHQLGFRGVYIIFDLPAFSSLQQFYLNSIGLKCTRSPAIDDNRPGIYLCSDLDAIRRGLSAMDLPTSSLFVATWSISEAPQAIRDDFIERMGKFSNWLIAYQDRFHEWDNERYFKQLAKTRQDFKWHSFPISHMPGHHYLIGEKKNASFPDHSTTPFASRYRQHFGSSTE